jgi:PAS domain S-box-containing protein
MHMRQGLPSGVSAYVIAVAATTAAVMLRWLFDSWLGNRLPFVTLFGAVAAAVWYGGYRPAFVATVLGFLACDYLFIEPRGTIVTQHAHDYIGLVLFLFTCFIIIGFGEGMRVAQRRTQEGQERLRTTLASIGDAVIATDAEGSITSMNLVAESLTGWENAEAVGQPLDAVFHILNEQTRRPVENPVQKVLKLGRVVGLANHTVLVAKDGTERPIDDSAAPIKEAQGNILGCVLIFRDITQRRRLEKENAGRLAAACFLASIVDSSNDAIISKSLDGTIQSWNAAAERIFGFTAEEAVGRHIGLVIPHDRTDEEERIVARLRAGERVNHFDTVRLRKDGEVIPVSLTISPIRDEAGRVIGASKIARDITDRKRAEQELHRLAARLSEGDRRKNEFLAMLAHELRNPLAPIRNAVQILLVKGPPDPDLQWCREVIDRQVKHMARLLDDLLDVSRITHNKLEPRKERVELAEVVQSAIETSRPLIDIGRQELTVALPRQPIYLDADPIRLAQVFSNLLNNAAKYSEPGGQIRLTGERQGCDVVVSVKDDGTGIAAEMLPRIFDIFSQAKRVLERSQGGLGIGLSLVRGLVELHGGSIEARSDGPGKGSEFIVRLPVLVERVVQEPVSPSNNVEQACVMKCRLLIVDDLKDSADSLAMLLKMMGHEVHTAYNGEDAIIAAGKFKPNVVLLDIGMPKINGYDACRRIRQQPWGKEMVLVALTGWGQEHDRRRTEEAGFNYHMVKPADPRELMTLLASRYVEPK